MDRITAATVFLETLSRGSISAAADHLGMSRAMASRYIDEMERWAEGRLLHRTTRRLSPTAIGETLVPVCEDLVRLSQDIQVLGAQSETTPTGLIRVTSSSIFSEHCLTDVLHDFLQQHPAVSIDLQVVDRPVDLAEEGIDLAIRVTNTLDPNLIARRVADVHSVVCASPEYLARYGTPADARQLGAHNCLTYAYFGPSTWQFRHHGEEMAIPVSGNFSTNEAALVVRSALRGAGIALLPRFAAAEHIERGHLVPLLKDFDVAPLGVHAMYLSRRRMPCALQALIAYLAQRLPDKVLGGPDAAARHARVLPCAAIFGVKDHPQSQVPAAGCIECSRT